MSKPEDLRSIMDSLRRIVRELRLFSRRAELDSGLSAAQLFVLERMAAHGSLSVNSLAELTLTHQSSVSVVAQRLEERGLIARHVSRRDRRRKELSITAAGRAVLKHAPLSVQDRLIAAGSALPPKERKSLARLLAFLVQKLNLDEAHPPLFFEQERPEPSVPNPDPTSAVRTPVPKAARRRK